MKTAEYKAVTRLPYKQTHTVGVMPEQAHCLGFGFLLIHGPITHTALLIIFEHVLQGYVHMRFMFPVDCTLTKKKKKMAGKISISRFYSQ